MTFEKIRQDYFPFSPTSGIQIRSVDMKTVYQVTGAISNQVFSPSTDLGLMPFKRAPDLLRQSLQRHQEQFVIYNANDEPIGWSIGEQRMDDTFIMLWTGILPAYQSQGIYTAFLKQFIRYLQALGYVRITSNHMVNNRAVLIAKLKAGFIVSGMGLDERIGAMLWLTYFIDKEAEEGYRSAFSLEKYESANLLK